MLVAAIPVAAVPFVTTYNHLLVVAFFLGSDLAHAPSVLVNIVPAP
jgi:hypothetical protein